MWDGRGTNFEFRSIDLDRYRYTRERSRVIVPPKKGDESDVSQRLRLAGQRVRYPTDGPIGLLPFPLFCPVNLQADRLRNARIYIYSPTARDDDFYFRRNDRRAELTKRTRLRTLIFNYFSF